MFNKNIYFIAEYKEEEFQTPARYKVMTLFNVKKMKIRGEMFSLNDF